MTKKQTESRFNRIVVVQNHFSSRSHEMGESIDDIKAKFGNRVVHLATHPSPRDTTDMLKSMVSDSDLVVTVGGDGTARTAVEALADPDVPAYNATLLPLPGGNRNDLPKQLHPAGMLEKPSKIIEQAAMVDIMPLRTAWEQNGETIEHLSALYSGLGGAATTAHYISSPDFRNKPGYRLSFMRDIYGIGTIPWTIKNVPSFIAESDGEIFELFDASIANASVLAQYLHPPVELADHKAFYAELRSKAPKKVIPYVLRMALPLLPPPNHTIMHPGDSRTITPLYEHTYLHLDGDSIRVAPGTPVSFGLHDKRFHALYSRHKVVQAVSNRRSAA